MRECQGRWGVPGDVMVKGKPSEDCRPTGRWHLLNPVARVGRRERGNEGGREVEAGMEGGGRL